MQFVVKEPDEVVVSQSTKEKRRNSKPKDAPEMGRMKPCT
jgi:hypothetical protein